MVESISAITLATHGVVRAVGFCVSLGFMAKYGGPSASFTSLQVGSGYPNLVRTAGRGSDMVGPGNLLRR